VISFLTDRRAGVTLENPNVPLSDGYSILEVLGGGSRSAAGAIVNATTAKQVSAVYAAVNTIAGSVGSLPVRIVQYRADGRTKDPVTEHPLGYLLNVQAAPGVIAASFKEDAMTHLLLRGNMVADVQRTRGRLGELESLHLLDPDMYEIELLSVGPRGSKVPAVILLPTASGEKGTVLSWERVLRVKGVGGDALRGWSVIKYARETIGAALGQEDYGSRFFSNGGTPGGTLEHPNALSPEAKDALRRRWEMLYGGSSNAHRVAVLEEGMKFNPITMNAEDTQFIESRKFTVREIARWFNIPPHKIGDMADAKWANIDAQNLEYFQDTLLPWLTRWKQSILSQLFRPDEIGARLSVEFDLRELLRGDVAARTAYYQARFNAASITPNEIRGEEGENPIAGGDEPFVQQQYIPLSMVADVLRNTMSGGDDADPTPPGGDDEAGGGAPGIRVRSAVERRSFEERLDLRDAFLPDFQDRAERLVRGELREVGKLVAKRLEGEVIDRDAFRQELGRYYFERFPDFADTVLGPGFRSYGMAVFGPAVREAVEIAPGVEPEDDDVARWIREYTERAIAGIAASGRKQIEAKIDRGEPEDRVSEVLERWKGEGVETTRADRIAERHINELNQGISKWAWGAMGVAAMVARTVGDSCPYCRAIDGRTVDIAGSFFNAGDELAAPGKALPLKFKKRVGHPPFHKGCDCVIRPA